MANENNTLKDVCSTKEDSILLDIDLVDGFTFYSFNSFEDLRAEFITKETFITTKLPLSLGCSRNFSVGPKPTKRPRKKISRDTENVIANALNDCSAKVIIDSENKTSVVPLNETKLDIVNVTNNNNNNNNNNNSLVSTTISRTSLGDSASKKDVTTSTSPILNINDNRNSSDKMSGVDVVMKSSSPLTSAVVANGHRNECGTSPIISAIVQHCSNAIKHKLEKTDSQDGCDSEILKKAPKLNSFSDNNNCSSSISVRYVNSSCGGSLTNGKPSSVANRSTWHMNNNLSPKESISPKQEKVSNYSQPLPIVDSVYAQSAPIALGAPSTTPMSEVDRSKSSSSSMSCGSRLNGSFISLPTTSALNAVCGSPTYIHQTKLHQHQYTHVQGYAAPSMLPPFAADVPFGLSNYPASLQTLPLVQLPSMKNVITHYQSSTPPPPPPPPPPTAKKAGRWCSMHIQIAWDIYNKRMKIKRDNSSSQGCSPSYLTKAKTDSTNQSGRSKDKALSKLPSPKSFVSSNSASSGNSNIPVSSSSSLLFSKTSTAEPRSNYTGFVQDNQKEYRAQSSKNGVVDPKVRADKERKERHRTSVGSSAVPTISNSSSSNSSGLTTKEKQRHSDATASFDSVRSSLTTTQADNSSMAAIAAALALAVRPATGGQLPMVPPFAPVNGHPSSAPHINPMVAQQSQLPTVNNSSLPYPSSFCRSRLTLPTAASSTNADSLRSLPAEPPSLLGQTSVGVARTAMLPLTSQSPMLNGQMESSSHLHNRDLTQTNQQHVQLSQRLTSAPDPLAALFMDAERALLNHSVNIRGNGFPAAVLPPFLPGLLNGNGVSAQLDPLVSAGFEPPSGALALYAGLLQRERFELERSRLLTNILPTVARSALVTAADRLGAYPSMTQSAAMHASQNGGHFVTGGLPSAALINGTSNTMVQPTLPFASFSQQAINKLIGNASSITNPYSITLQQMAGLDGAGVPSDILASLMTVPPTAAQHSYH